MRKSSYYRYDGFPARAGNEGSDSIESTHRMQDGYAGDRQDFVLVREKSGLALPAGMCSGKREFPERASGYPEDRGNRTGMMTGMRTATRIFARSRGRAEDDEE